MLQLVKRETFKYNFKLIKITLRCKTKLRQIKKMILKKDKNPGENKRIRYNLIKPKVKKSKSPKENRKSRKIRRTLNEIQKITT